jgi:hypothetical protein
MTLLPQFGVQFPLLVYMQSAPPPWESQVSSVQTLLSSQS